MMRRFVRAWWADVGHRHQWSVRWATDDGLVSLRGCATCGKLRVVQPRRPHLFRFPTAFLGWAVVVSAFFATWPAFRGGNWHVWIVSLVLGASVGWHLSAWANDD